MCLEGDLFPMLRVIDLRLFLGQRRPGMVREKTQILSFFNTLLLWWRFSRQFLDDNMLFQRGFLVRACFQDLEVCGGSISVDGDSRSWTNGG